MSERKIAGHAIVIAALPAERHPEVADTHNRIAFAGLMHEVQFLAAMELCVDHDFSPAGQRMTALMLRSAASMSCSSASPLFCFQYAETSLAPSSNVTSL